MLADMLVKRKFAQQTHKKGVNKVQVVPKYKELSDVEEEKSNKLLLVGVNSRSRSCGMSVSKGSAIVLLACRNQPVLSRRGDLCNRQSEGEGNWTLVQSKRKGRARKCFNECRALKPGLGEKSSSVSIVVASGPRRLEHKHESNTSVVLPVTQASCQEGIVLLVLLLHLDAGPGFSKVRRALWSPDSWCRVRCMCS